MNRRAIGALVRRDLKIVLQSHPVLIPIITVPVLLLVIFPAIGGLLLSNATPDSALVADLQGDLGALLTNLPPRLSERLASYETDVQRLTYLLFNLLFPPMYLMLPTLTANVIAADSFVGEKERKTLEALIYAPTTDRDFYLAKLLAPWLLGVAVGALSYAAFVLVVTATTLPLMGNIFVLDAAWLLLVIWVTPAAAGMGLGAMVLVSSRVDTFQEAYQLGGLIVLPLLLLLIGQLSGAVYLSPLVVLALGGLLWAVTLALVFYGERSFQRSALMARL